jgi:hypothetical protein
LLKGISFTSTGRFTENRICGGGVCGQGGFKKVVELQSGTFTNSITPFTQVMIVGEDPSLLALAEANKRRIVTVAYALLRVCIRWEITSIVFVQMGKYMGERVDIAIRGESGLVPSSNTQVVSQPGGGGTDQMEVEDGDGGAAAQTTDQASTPTPTIKSALKPNTTPKISIDQAALNRIRNMEEVTPLYNVRLRNTGNSEKFLQLIFNHSDDEGYNALVSIKSRFTKIVNLLHLVDSDLSINGVYGDPPMPPITNSRQLPADWLPLQAYIFINNSQTLQPSYTNKDGNVRRQAPTYTTVRVSTKVDINYAISILAVNLLEHNCKIFVKALDVLTSKPRFAIMGTHVN